jgi:hypothetical protein
MKTNGPTNPRQLFFILKGQLLFEAEGEEQLEWYAWS